MSSTSGVRSIKKKTDNQITGEQTIPENVEELAQAARKKRAQSCHEEIEKVLEKWNCRQVAFIQSDGGPIPVDQILRLPSGVGVVAK